MLTRSRRCVLAVLCFSAALALTACTSSSDGSSGGNNLGKPAVTATAGAGKITLDWDAISGADSYTLTFANSSGGQPSTTGLTISSTIENVEPPYEHDYLIYGETYFYIVTAVGSSDTTASDEVSATPERVALADIEFASELLESCVMATVADAFENEGAEFADEIVTLVGDGAGEESGAEPGGPTWATGQDTCASHGSGDTQVTALSGLEYLTGLTQLDLWVNGTTDATPLQPLLQLTYLNLFGNHITDFSPLGSLVNLETLEMHSMQDGPFTNVDALHALTNAQEINLDGNSSYLRCTDLEALIDALGADVVSPSTVTDCLDE